MANKFDLTPKNISKTFGRLTQITGSDQSNIFNAKGDPVNQIRMSGSIVLKNTPTTAAFLEIDDYTSLSPVTNRLHSRDGELFWGATLLANGSSVTGILSLVQDDSPELGGNLDVNTNDIRGIGNIGLNGSASFTTMFANEITASGEILADSFRSVTGGNVINFNDGFNVDGNITASGHISASGTIYADEIVLGSGTGGAGAGLTSEGDLIVSGDISASGDLNIAGKITASSILIKSDNIVSDTIENFFLIKSGSFDALKVNEQSVMVLGGFHFEPTAVPGGFHYRAADDEFYVGKNN
tara:strand:- start:13 stop:906 length:894 start_codon:yes stop_codon:yes gene_type:complete